MFYQNDGSSGNGENDFQNVRVGVDLRHTHRSDSGVSPSDQGWLTEGGDLSGEYPTGTSPGSQEGSKSRTPSPKSPSHQLQSVKPQSSRQRTSQACDKCRERKTKCSGHRPVCLRCTNRGLICEYSMRESRSRTPARPRVAVRPETPQVEHTGQGRPTPAHHSRIGGSRTNAFAPSTRSYTGTTATRNANRSSLSASSAHGATDIITPNISVQQSHRSQQPQQLHDTSTSNAYSNQTTVNSLYSARGTWPMCYTSLPLNYSFGSSSYDHALLQPDYEISSLLLPSTPALPHDFDSRPAQTFPCCVNEDPSCYIPPYTPNVDSTYFQGGFPDPIYHVNNSNSITTTVSNTPMGSQLDLACPTPSIPVDPAAFREVGGAFSRGFDFNPPSEFRYPSPPLADRTDYFGYSSFK
ncbi:hypothetical protein CVT25_015250 [Psilocybe cyanescens]|uniref:Zn(2)-C6 fungal-type domain-containing protein n=1 Tax=Psilocybe cyanescens TaxID=93625 RepID=A0A409XR15_PSICY|nr:hypothetical protein CVT25_015250 [Psilocybe cyanescens]